MTYVFSLSQVRRLNAAVAVCRYFPKGRCRLIIVYTTFDFKKFIFFKLRLNVTKFKS